MRTQYRVLWKRDGLRPKAKPVMSLATADRFIGLLTSPEPWRFMRDYHDRDPDSYRCCDGHECGCGGQTIREFCEEARKDLPPIEWVRIESRQVTPYAPMKTEMTSQGIPK